MEYLDALEFDRELSLEELLDACDRKLLMRMLDRLFESGYAITSLPGAVLLGTPSTNLTTRTELVLELEPIGYLAVSAAEQGLLEVASDCLSLQLRFAQKYLMASALHIEAVQEDYRKLREEHEALQASELRYRELSEHLDDKVHEQVRLIEGQQRKLFQSEKQAAVGHLAAGMAHEINNPIGFINSNLNTAKGYVGDLQEFGAALAKATDLAHVQQRWKKLDLDFVLEDFLDLLNDCASGGQRIAAIVADLKLFSNVDGEDCLVVPLNTYIQSSINMARVSIGDDRQIVFIPGELPPIPCKPAFIGQVMLALLLNANDACVGREGDLEVRTSALEDRVQISVKDAGLGIPEEVLAKVFDPFFTTKDVGKGKGLGLTSCREIVRGHGGDITIQSEPGRGTTVSFWLPVTAVEIRT